MQSSTCLVRSRCMSQQQQHSGVRSAPLSPTDTSTNTCCNRPQSAAEVINAGSCLCSEVDLWSPHSKAPQLFLHNPGGMNMRHPPGGAGRRFSNPYSEIINAIRLPTNPWKADSPTSLIGCEGKQIVQRACAPDPVLFPPIQHDVALSRAVTSRSHASLPPTEQQCGP